MSVHQNTPHPFSLAIKQTIIRHTLDGYPSFPQRPSVRWGDVATSDSERKAYFAKCRKLWLLICRKPSRFPS